jgi:hypothetical protein
MASYIGIPPIANLGVIPSEPDFILAKSILDDVKRSTLSQGLPCNSDKDITLTDVNDSGYVIVPEGALICDVTSYGYADRDGLIYNLKTREFSTDTSLKADIVWNWEFDSLPELVKQYITITASRAFVARVKGDDASINLTIPDERRIKQEFQRYVLHVGDVSTLDYGLPFIVSRLGRSSLRGYGG